jgi:hypothetical protein
VAISAVKLIEKHIQKPPRESRILSIDPKSAERILLERNTGNRPRKPNKVEQFASDMAVGRWGLTGDTVKFALDGRLLDGQNRLAACVRAGRPFRTHVVFGIDPKLFPRMDVGKPRNAADILHIAGFQYASTLAAALRWAYLFDNDPHNRETLKPEFVLELARKHYRDIGPHLKEGREINRQYGHPAGQMAALMYKFSKADRADALDFMRAWMRGHREGRHHIIDVMQTLLQSIKATNNGRIHELTRAAAIIKAWNIFRGISKGSAAQLRAVAEKHEIEPVS